MQPEECNLTNKVIDAILASHDSPFLLQVTKRLMSPHMGIKFTSNGMMGFATLAGVWLFVLPMSALPDITEDDILNHHREIVTGVSRWATTTYKIATM